MSELRTYTYAIVSLTTLLSYGLIEATNPAWFFMILSIVVLIVIRLLSGELSIKTENAFIALFILLGICGIIFNRF